jgi:hypothetical protein
MISQYFTRVTRRHLVKPFLLAVLGSVRPLSKASAPSVGNREVEILYAGELSLALFDSRRVLTRDFGKAFSPGQVNM